MNPHSTIDALFKAEVITEADIQSAIDVFETNPYIETVALGGYSLNLQATVRARSLPSWRLPRQEPATR